MPSLDYGLHYKGCLRLPGDARQAFSLPSKFGAQFDFSLKRATCWAWIQIQVPVEQCWWTIPIAIRHNQRTKKKNTSFWMRSSSQS